MIFFSREERKKKVAKTYYIGSSSWLKVRNKNLNPQIFTRDCFLSELYYSFDNIISSNFCE